MPDDRNPKYPPESWSIEEPFDFDYLSRPEVHYEDEDELGDGTESAEASRTRSD